MGITKVHDDIGTIFLSSTRMFLAIPILLCVGLALLLNNKKHLKEILLGTAILFTGIKVFLVKDTIEQHTAVSNHGPVAVIPIDSLHTKCHVLSQDIADHAVDHVILIPTGEGGNTSDMYFLNYGCEGLGMAAMPTMMTMYERRASFFINEKTAVHDRVLLVNVPNGSLPLLGKLKNTQIIRQSPNVVLVSGNTLSTKEITSTLEIPLRRNAYFE
jgi:hypothetical protein